MTDFNYQVKALILATTSPSNPLLYIYFLPRPPLSHHIFSWDNFSSNSHRPLPTLPEKTSHMYNIFLSPFGPKIVELCLESCVSDGWHTLIFLMLCVSSFATTQFFRILQQILKFFNKSSNSYWSTACNCFISIRAWRRWCILWRNCLIFSITRTQAVLILILSCSSLFKLLHSILIFCFQTCPTLLA